jgi:UDP-N-acetylmuramate dehydrogenase
MGHLKENVSLQSLHTFGLDIKARWYIEIASPRQACEFLMDNLEPQVPRLILGGGSNVLFKADFPGLVLRNAIQGRAVLFHSDREVMLKVGAGENWHELVQYTLAQGWGGLENLSLIPGSVGATPIQNIGAYGVELKESFESLEALHLQTGQFHTFGRQDCAFGYRDSVFKRQAKGQYLITSVTLRLTPAAHHALNTSYGAIQAELQRLGQAPSIHSVSQAVINIRQRKLPDPAQIGNSGSFFKNPVIPAEHLARIQAEHPQAPYYSIDPDQVKVPAGWLIEACGWKGYRRGDAGVHPKQALVLVNYGCAQGTDIYQLSEEIMASVEARFGITLEREVNVVG